MIASAYTYTAIVDHRCDAWNKPAEQPWRVMTIGTRQWVPGHTPRVLVLCVPNGCLVSSGQWITERDQVGNVSPNIGGPLKGASRVAK